MIDFANLPRPPSDPAERAAWDAKREVERLAAAADLDAKQRLERCKHSIVAILSQPIEISHTLSGGAVVNLRGQSGGKPLIARYYPPDFSDAAKRADLAEMNKLAGYEDAVWKDRKLLLDGYWKKDSWNKADGSGKTERFVFIAQYVRDLDQARDVSPGLPLLSDPLASALPKAAMLETAPAVDPPSLQGVDRQKIDALPAGFLDGRLIVQANEPGQALDLRTPVSLLEPQHWLVPDETASPVVRLMRHAPEAFSIAVYKDRKPTGEILAGSPAIAHLASTFGAGKFRQLGFDPVKGAQALLNKGHAMTDVMQVIDAAQAENTKRVRDLAAYKEKKLGSAKSGEPSR